MTPLSPSERRAFAWLLAGHSGTTREIATAAGVGINSVQRMLRRRDIYITQVGTKATKTTHAPVWAWNGVEPPAQREPEPQQEYVGGPVVQQALAKRTELERAWR